MHAGRPQPAEIAYPDPLTGFAAFAAALRALGADELRRRPPSRLAGTIAPLLAAGPRPLSTGDPTAVARLARATGGAMAAPLYPTGSGPVAAADRTERRAPRRVGAGHVSGVER